MAKRYVKVSLVVNGLTGLLLGSLVWLLKNYIAQIFTDKQELLDIITPNLFLISILVLLSSFDNVGRGALVGLGK